MICLNDLPPERKKAAHDYLEDTWPELIEDIRKYKQDFGVVIVYYEERKDDSYE